MNKLNHEAIEKKLQNIRKQSMKSLDVIAKEKFSLRDLSLILESIKVLPIYLSKATAIKKSLNVDPSFNTNELEEEIYNNLTPEAPSYSISNFLLSFPEEFSIEEELCELSIHLDSIASTLSSLIFINFKKIPTEHYDDVIFELLHDFTTDIAYNVPLAIDILEKILENPKPTRNKKSY